VESFNGRRRGECLTAHLVLGDNALTKIEVWRRDFNVTRLHVLWAPDLSNVLYRAVLTSPDKAAGLSFQVEYFPDREQ